MLGLRNISIVLIFRCRKYFVHLFFVHNGEYENIMATKISSNYGIGCQNTGTKVKLKILLDKYLVFVHSAYTYKNNIIRDASEYSTVRPLQLNNVSRANPTV